MPGNNRVIGVKKSDFNADTTIPGTATFDYVSGNVNTKITFSNLLINLGVTGSIEQVGDPTGVPVLDDQGSIKGIRNLVGVGGVSVSIDAQNSIQLSAASTFDGTGIELVDNAAASILNYRSLVAGANMLITSPSNGQIVIAFDESQLLAANVIIINSAGDFPAAVGGLIELTGGSDMAYIIDAASINMGTDRFTATGGSCAIVGSSRFSSKLTSTTTGDLFTSTNCNLSVEVLGIDSANSPYLFNFSAAGLNSLVLRNAVIFDCQKIATIAGAFTTSLRTLAVISTSVGGIEWTGSDNRQINVTENLALGWTGALFDLGTATFDLIDFSSDNRFTSSVGTTIISGAASSANIDVGGRAIIRGVLFNGLGSALNGVTPQDLRWDFSGNIFSDNVTKNTKSSAKAIMSSATTAPTAAAGSGVFVAVAGVNWTASVSNRWSISTAGVATFLGLDDMEFFISHHSTVEPASGGAVEMQAQLRINAALQAETIGATTSGNAAGVAGDGLFNISNGDTVQLDTAVIGSVDIDFTRSGVSIIEA